MPVAGWCDFSYRTHDSEPFARVKVLPWPSKSPDLNPVEHIWDYIDRMVRRRGPVNVRQYYSNLQWNAIAQRTCLRYVASMRSRCQADTQVNIGHTRY